MELPARLLDELRAIKSFDEAAFVKVHSSGEQVTSIRVNPLKIQGPSSMPFFEGVRGEAIPWTKFGYYLNERPSFTFDPLFHAGCYYVQEASSMFLEQALQQAVDLSANLKVLDLCGAPGGKSTHIHSLITTGSLLVSNEVIRARASVLKENMIKWGCENVVITNNDPKDFSRLEHYFDVIVADAPCSGSGLFRRDPGAIEEWSENNVQLCSQRQQRILADVWPCLKQDGLLIYSTCSYSFEEDEQITEWLQHELHAEYIPLQLQPGWNIVDTGKGYRFWPDKVKGEGFFIACFRKKNGERESKIKTRQKPATATKEEEKIVARWINASGKQFIKYDNRVYAWPEQWMHDMSWLLERCRVLYSGVLTGELFHAKLVPDHALAMSVAVHKDIGKVELNEEEAIHYLKRKDFSKEIVSRGWQLVTYKEHPLGWINVLPNRINNYYPKESRILKDN